MSQLAVAGGIGRSTAARGLRVADRAPGEGIVWRTALVNRLRAARSASVVTIVAPGGYGKTTVLEQWAVRDAREFVRLSAAGCTGDPAALLGEIDASLAAGEKQSGSAIRSRPVVVVVDDAHLLQAASRAAVAELIRRAGGGATVVLAGRGEPKLPNLSVPRLRARGELLELGPQDLTLSRREVRTLTRAAGKVLTDVQLDALVEETEGEPAAVQAAASARRRRSLQSRALAALTPAQRVFLRRTSVLDRLSRPLCDAVLGHAPGTREPESIAELSAFLVPLDRERGWFRHHRLFRARLRRELEAAEPELVPVLHERAAVWHQEHGEPADALAHAAAARDVGRYMTIFATIALPAYDGGEDVDEWLRCVAATDRLERYPEAAALAARLHAHHGRARETASCLDAADRGLAAGRSGSPAEDAAVRSRAGLVHAATGGKRPRTMANAAGAALEQLPGDDPWRPYGLLLSGVAHLLLGDEESADRILAEAAETAECLGATEIRTLALTERGLLADARDDHAAADALLDGARASGDGPAHPSYALTLAASARLLLRHRRWSEARRALATAQRLLPRLTEALPWLAVQTRLELAAANVMLRDAAAARLLLRQVDELLRGRPAPGILARQRGRLGDEAAGMPADGSAVRLTGAELRLLPLLSTHLSFREIGSHFHLSRHTVKTQAISAYRKLGASSRSEAVECAERLGLVDPAADGAHILIPSG
jgi:LuxR family transcriptional regulator, maltose regulon positive regulatory protein